MRKYIFQRIWTSLLTLFVVITLTFFMMRAIPGGPFTDEKGIPPHIMAKIMERYRLNDPLYVQYGRYLWDVLRFDLGPSYRYEGMTVNKIISDSFPVSLMVGSMALALALAVGIPAGIVSALRRGRWQDRSAMVLATLGITIPNFVIATTLVYLFAYRWGWVTVGFWEGLPTAVLPALTLAGYPTAFISRLTRSSMPRCSRSTARSPPTPRGPPTSSMRAPAVRHQLCPARVLPRRQNRRAPAYRRY